MYTTTVAFEGRASGQFAMCSACLLSSGVLPETPCAIISGATSETEQVHVTTVARLLSAPHFSAPRLLVVGEVVSFAETREAVEKFSKFVGHQYLEASPSTGENPS